VGHAAARAVVGDPRADPTDRRLAEIGLVRALRTVADDPALVGVVRWIASSSPNAASRREATEALARDGR
jgi:hypothetical protein